MALVGFAPTQAFTNGFTDRHSSLTLSQSHNLRATIYNTILRQLSYPDDSYPLSTPAN